MTKRQRAQVVELLRCAADDGVGGSAAGLVGMFGAADALGLLPGGVVEATAWDALDAVPWTTYYRPSVGRNESYRERLLEAAQRVEDGEWP